MRSTSACSSSAGSTGSSFRSATRRTRTSLRALERLRVPVVVLDRNVSVGQAHHVYTDHQPGMRHAVGHLLDLGHRRIAHDLRPTAAADERAARGLGGVLRAERHLPKTYTVLQGTLSVEYGARATAELLALADPPTAIIAGGNQLMLGAIRVLARARHAARAARCRSSAATTFRSASSTIPRSPWCGATTPRSAAAPPISCSQALLDPDYVADMLLPAEFIARPSCGPVPPNAADAARPGRQEPIPV